MQKNANDIRKRTSARLRRYAAMRNARLESAARVRRLKICVKLACAALIDIYHSLPQPVQTALCTIAGATVALQVYTLLMQLWLACLI